MFKEESDPVEDMGIGRIKVKMAGESHVYEMSVRTFKLIKEYERIMRRLAKVTKPLLEARNEGKITLEQFRGDEEANKIYEEGEAIYKEILAAGGNKHWVRNSWRRVK